MVINGLTEGKNPGVEEVLEVISVSNSSTDYILKIYLVNVEDSDQLIPLRYQGRGRRRSCSPPGTRMT